MLAERINILRLTFCPARCPKLDAGHFYFLSLECRGLGGSTYARFRQTLKPCPQIFGQNGDPTTALNRAKTSGANLAIERGSAEATRSNCLRNGERELFSGRSHVAVLCCSVRPYWAQWTTWDICG